MQIADNIVTPSGIVVWRDGEAVTTRITEVDGNHGEIWPISHWASVIGRQREGAEDRNTFVDSRSVGGAKEDGDNGRSKGCKLHRADASRYSILRNLERFCCYV